MNHDQTATAVRWHDTAGPALPSLHRLPPHLAAKPQPVAPAAPPVVFVADADAAVRESLDRLIRFAGWRSESFASAQDCLDVPPPRGPSCMVLDVKAPHRTGLDWQRRIAAERKEMPIIFITGDADVRVAVQAMKAGAVDFLTKPVRNDSLLRAIEISLRRSRAALDQAAAIESLRDRHGTLSRREQEVMSLVVRGLLNKQIGGELGISEITVKAHRGSAMRKMKARSLADLVRMSIQLREAAAPALDMAPL